MATRKSQEEILTEAKALKAIKPKVKRYSMFGDDHHEAIDAQLDVLEEDMTNDDIYDRWDENGDGESSVLTAALEARDWMDGAADETPSENWKSLAK